MTPRKCINKGCDAKPESFTSYFAETIKFKGTFRVFKHWDCQKCKANWKAGDKILSGREVTTYKKSKREEEKRRKELGKKLLPKIITYDKKKAKQGQKTGR